MKRGSNGLGQAKPLKQTTVLKRGTAKPKKPKTKSVSKLRGELDVVFGRFIKYRDGKMVDGEWVCTCCTCGKPFVYRDRDGKRYTTIQAGHFMSRSYSATRFDERNVHAQCAYCVTPDTRVLMADFTWKKVGEVKLGDKLIGFDEENAVDSLRRYKVTTVTSLGRTKAPVYEVSLDNGDKIKTTGEHKWLARYGKTTGFRWIETQKLWVNSRNLLGHKIQGSGKEHTYSTVCKPFEVVEQDTSYESGWLAGMLDADGHITQQVAKDKRKVGACWWGLRVGISQNSGIIAHRIEQELSRLSNNRATCRAQVKSKIYSKDGKEYNSKGTNTYLITGTNIEKIQFLQRIRPLKLSKVDPNKLGRLKSQFDTQVVGIRPLGEQEVVVMETDSHTFIAEGYAMHNCNKWRSGEQYKMSLYIDARYGVGVAAELANLAEAGFSLKRDWLLEKLAYYKAAIDKDEQRW